MFLSLCLVTSCGYRAGVGSCIKECETVAVPYACGDLDGSFTRALIKEIAISGRMSYESICPKYILEVALIDREEESIGYRYEEKEDGEFGKRLVAAEERISMGARVKLVDARTQKVVVGPFCVYSKIDFDFAPETSPQDKLRFSLGQLDLKSAAIDAANQPLHEILARKIVSYLTEGY